MNSFFRTAFMAAAMFVSLPSGFAQKPEAGQFYFRVNPLSFFEPQAGPVVGFEVFLSPNFSIGSDVGWLLYAPYLFDDNNSFEDHDLDGFRVKPELRYYFESSSKKANRFFIAVEGIYLKAIRTNANDGIPVYDESGQYIESYDGAYKQTKETIGGSMKAGIQLPLARKKDRAFVEFFVGVGMKGKNFTYTGLPKGADISYIGDGSGLDANDEGIFPTMPAGVKFVFRL